MSLLGAEWTAGASSRPGLGPGTHCPPGCCAPGSVCAAFAGGQPIGGDGVAVGKPRLIHGGIHGVVHSSYRRGATADEKLTPRRQDAEAVRRTQRSFAPFAPLRQAQDMLCVRPAGSFSGQMLMPCAPPRRMKSSRQDAKTQRRSEELNSPLRPLRLCVRPMGRFSGQVVSSRRLPKPFLAGGDRHVILSRCAF
jgi:hypothetical protein